MEALYGQIHLKRDHTSKCRLCSAFPNTRKTEQSCQKLFCIVVIINCILISALIVTVYYWKCQVRSLTSSGHVKEQQFCLNCEEISVHPLDDENILKEFERKDNGTKCCTKDTSQLKHLVHQFLERNHRMYMAKEGITIPQCPDYTTGVKPAGRVVDVDRNWIGNDYEERHVLRWLNTGNYSYQNPGVTFTDGQLEITTPGVERHIKTRRVIPYGDYWSKLCCPEAHHGGRPGLVWVGFESAPFCPSACKPRTLTTTETPRLQKARVINRINHPPVIEKENIQEKRENFTEKEKQFLQQVYAEGMTTVGPSSQKTIEEVAAALNTSIKRIDTWIGKNQRKLKGNIRPKENKKIRTAQGPNGYSYFCCTKPRGQVHVPEAQTVSVSVEP